MSKENGALEPAVAPPGDSSDSVKKRKSARQLLVFLSVINGVFGLLSLGNIAALEKMGMGPANLLFCFLYGGFALLADSSRAAMVGALILMGGDSLLVLLGGLASGQGLPWVVLLFRASIIVSLAKAVGGPAPPPPERRVFARRALLVFLLGSEGILLLMAAVGTFLPTAQDEVPQAIELAPAGEFQAQRASQGTHLTRHRPSPQPFETTPLPPGIEPIVFPSGSLQLAGWYARPAGAPSTRRPGVVYLHGGFAFGADDITEAKAFLDAGYPVLFASLRGENGNPGDFELMFGELDDAAAAVRWLAARPEVDPAQVFAFGHSSGGGSRHCWRSSPICPWSPRGARGGSIWIPSSSPGRISRPSTSTTCASVACVCCCRTLRA